jgi:hypothetical protein
VESRDCTVVDVLRERAEGGIGGRFWGKVCKLFAVDVCFDDPRSFSVLFRLRVFFVCWRGQKLLQKRGHMTVAVVVCFVDNCCSLGRPRCAVRGRPCRGGEVDAVRLVSGFVLLVILA